MPNLTLMLIQLGVASLTILFAITGLVLLFVHKNKKLKKNILIVAVAIVLFLFLLISFLVVFLNRYPIIRLKRQFIPAIPRSVREITDKYVVRKVGEEYFKINFIFNKTDSEKYLDNPYKVRYYFLPLKNYTNDYILEIEVQNNQIVGGSNIPDCLKDKSLCQFNLTREEFLNIKNNYKFIDKLEFDPPFIISYICPDILLLQIDYRTKEVSYGQSNYNESSIITPCTRFAD